MEAIKPFEEIIRQQIIDSQKLFKLAAIWMDKVIVTGGKQATRRLSPGMTVRVVEGFIATDGEPTHYINECWGTLYNTELYFDLINIETDQPLRLKVK